MFYGTEILLKKTGRFGIIWMAATNENMLKPREYLSVNINRSCEELMQYIEVRHRQPARGMSRVRFSLYLSSQLIYGLIKVFHRQQEFLFADLMGFLKKLRVVWPAHEAHINLPSNTRPDTCTLADPTQLSLNGELADFDSFQIIFAQTSEDFWAPTMFPERQPTIIPTLDSTPLLTHKEILKQATESPLAAPEDSITIHEPPAADISNISNMMISGEVDIPPFPDDDLLLLQMDEQMPEVGPLLSPLRGLRSQSRDDSARSTVVPEHLEKNLRAQNEVTPDVFEEQLMLINPKTGRLEVLSPDVTYTSPVQGIMPGRKPRKMRQKSRRRLNLSMELSPLPMQPKTTTVRTEPARKIRIRKLIIDKETKLSRAALNEGMQEAGRLRILRYREIPDVNLVEQNVLFMQTGSFGSRRGTPLNRNLMQLFTRNCRTKGVIEPDQEEIWTISSEIPESSSGSDVAAPSKDVTQVVPEDTSAMELQRDGSLTHSRAMPNITPLELSKDSETSRRRKPSDTPPHPLTSSRVPSFEKSRSFLSLPDVTPLEMVPEEFQPNISMPESEAKELPQVSHAKAPRDRRTSDKRKHSRHIYKKIFIQKLKDLLETEDGLTSFHVLCPPGMASRSEAALLFSLLLDAVAQQKISVQQNTPFSEIYISYGERWLS